MAKTSISQPRLTRVPRHKSAPESALRETPESDRGRPYVIYNPVKVGRLHRLRKLVTIAAAEAGMGEPVFIETSEEDPGTGQAAQAVADGATLVLAAGGDGTVRAVAAGLAYMKIPMAIIPAGTGNLMARNLAIPTDDLQEAVDIAFFGYNFQSDLAWLRVEEIGEASKLPPEGSLIPAGHRDLIRESGNKVPAEDEYAFLVIAGQGWDAELMASTNSHLKSAVGWGAYVVAGAQALRAPKLSLRVFLDEHDRFRVCGRSILFANCSSLMAGVVLVPDAELDDGKLDITVLDTKVGIFGWMDLFTKIAAQGIGIHRDALPGTTGNLSVRTARKAVTESQKPHPIQVDGDAIGTARRIMVRTDQHALVIRHG